MITIIHIFIENVENVVRTIVKLNWFLSPKQSAIPTVCRVSSKNFHWKCENYFPYFANFFTKVCILSQKWKTLAEQLIAQKILCFD